MTAELEVLRACERRYELAEGAAQHHATECDRLRQVQEEFATTMRREVVKYLMVIRDLRDDRTVLANEVRSLRQYLSQREEESRKIADAAPPDLVYEARQAMGEDQWGMASVDLRAGALSVMPLLMRARNSIETVDTDSKKLERKFTATSTELTSLRKEYELVQQVSQARLDQIEAERQRVEESTKTVSHLKRELSEMSMQLTHHHNQTPLPPTPGVAPSPAPHAPPLPAVPSLEGLTSGSPCSGSTPLSLGTKYKYVSLLCQDPDVASPLSSSDTDWREVLKAVQSGSHDALVARMAEKCQQLSDENEQLKQQASTAGMAMLAQQQAAVERLTQEKDALLLQKDDLGTQLQALQAFADCAADDSEEAGEKRLQALRKVVEQRDAYKAQAHESDTVLKKAREDIVAYKDLINAKRNALAEQLKLAQEATDDAERQVECEKERFQAQQKELELLREQASSRVLYDSTTATEVLDCQFTEEHHRMLLMEQEACDRPCIPTFCVSRRVQAPLEGECPSWMWEAGSPTAEELADTPAMDVSTVLRLKIDDRLEYTTVLVVPDTTTVGHLLERFALQMNTRFGVDVAPQEMALVVKDDDESALLEWVDEEASVFLEPNTAPPFSTLFSPRKQVRRRAGPPIEYPFSDRPLRSLSHIYQNYVVTGVCISGEVRVWFTVAKAAVPLPPPAEDLVSPMPMSITTLTFVREAARKWKDRIPERQRSSVDGSATPGEDSLRRHDALHESGAGLGLGGGVGGGGGGGGAAEQPEAPGVGARIEDLSGASRAVAKRPSAAGLFPPGSPRLPKRKVHQQRKSISKGASPLSPGPPNRRSSPTQKNRRASMGVPGSSRRASAAPMS